MATPIYLEEEKFQKEFFSFLSGRKILSDKNLEILVQRSVLPEVKESEEFLDRAYGEAHKVVASMGFKRLPGYVGNGYRLSQ